jgi:hypothetical protein
MYYPVKAKKPKQEQAQSSTSSIWLILCLSLMVLNLPAFFLLAQLPLAVLVFIFDPSAFDPPTCGEICMTPQLERPGVERHQLGGEIPDDQPDPPPLDLASGSLSLD